MGSLNQDLATPYDTIKAIAANISTDSHLIVKLRSLWLLQQVAGSYNVQRESENMPKDLFEPLVQYFCSQTEFVLQY
jgi:hypothetical protein